MSALTNLIEDIKLTLAHSEAVPPEKIQILAAQYAEECRKLNERFRNILLLLQHGNLSEAIRLAEMSPNLNEMGQAAVQPQNIASMPLPFGFTPQTQPIPKSVPVPKKAKPKDNIQRNTLIAVGIVLLLLLLLLLLFLFKPQSGGAGSENGDTQESAVGASSTDAGQQNEQTVPPSTAGTKTQEELKDKETKEKAEKEAKEKVNKEAKEKEAKEKTDKEAKEKVEAPMNESDDEKWKDCVWDIPQLDPTTPSAVLPDSKELGSVSLTYVSFVDDEKYKNEQNKQDITIESVRIVADGEGIKISLTDEAKKRLENGNDEELKQAKTRCEKVEKEYKAAKKELNDKQKEVTRANKDWQEREAKTPKLSKMSQVNPNTQTAKDEDDRIKGYEATTQSMKDKANTLQQEVNKLQASLSELDKTLQETKYAYNAEKERVNKAKKSDKESSKIFLAKLIITSSDGKRKKTVSLWKPVNDIDRQTKTARMRQGDYVDNGEIIFKNKNGDAIFPDTQEFVITDNEGKEHKGQIDSIGSGKLGITGNTENKRTITIKGSNKPIEFTKISIKNGDEELVLVKK